MNQIGRVSERSNGSRHQTERYVSRYLDEAAQVLRELDRDTIIDVVMRLSKLRAGKGRLFLLGVGGSATNASHAVNDFRKIAKIEAYAPTDNVGELTARINDEGWESCFSEWLRASRLTKDDVVMVMSVGGGSATTSLNLVRAEEYAKSVGAWVVGLVSSDGGYTRRLADACVLIPPQSDDTVTPLAESFQALIWHLLATSLTVAEVVADENIH